MILGDLSLTETAVLDELIEWIKIPSISGVRESHADLVRGGEWLRDRLVRFCDDVQMTDDDAPLVVARISATDLPAAGTYLVYGHYDVQPVGSGWTREPFGAEVDEGWIHGRGSSDDKGQFIALIRAIEMLAQVGKLGINVVILADGDEEALGQTSSEWLQSNASDIDGAILYDSSFLNENTPVINTSTRGLIDFRLKCVTGEKNLHSGLAGGVALNALHVLVDVLAQVLPHRGRLPEPFHAGVIAPSESEVHGWNSLPSGSDLLAAQGGREADPGAASEYYMRTLALPSLDLHEIAVPDGGSARTAVITTATARASIRLAPGQDADELIGVLTNVIEECEARIPTATLSLEVMSKTNPSLCDEDEPLIAAGVAAFERVWKQPVKVVRAGGTLPIVAEMTRQKMPFLLTGLHLPEGNAHGPDEKFKLSHLYDGIRMSCLVLDHLGGRHRITLHEEVAP